MQVVLLGATGHLGRFVRRELAIRGHEVASVARSEEARGRLLARGAAAGEGPVIVSSLEAASDALRAAIRGAEALVVCLPVQLGGIVLRMLTACGGDPGLPPALRRVVVVSSMRAVSRVADPTVAAVRAAETQWIASPFAPLVVRATMIFGDDEDRNLARVFAWAQRHRWIPLPAGRVGLVQPIGVDDLARALVAAIELDDDAWHGAAGTTIALGGETPIALRDLLAACYRAAVGRAPRFIPLPLALLRLASVLQHAIPLGPRISAAQIARLREDKIVDLTPARTLLGFSPTPLRIALAQKAARERERAAPQT